MPFPREMTKRLGKLRHWRCEWCGRAWADGWMLEGHHKVPSHMNGQDTDENFLLLCVECHMKAHDLLAQADYKSARLVEARLKKTKGRWK